MSYADVVFKENCKDILTNGTDTQGQEVRPHWPDGASAYTIKKFGVCNRYDLRKEFPLMTLRRTGIKSATDEVLWIWQRKSNNIHDLNSSIWDEWADPDGSINAAYGYQAGVKNICKGVTEEKLLKAFPNLVPYEVVYSYGDCCKSVYYLDKRDVNQISEEELRKNAHAIYEENPEESYWMMDQVDKALYDLKLTPFSRRIMLTTWNVSDLHDMNLEPCAYSMTFNVTDDKREDGKLTLNAILNQRSQDMLAANNWNIAQYSALLMMFAQVVGMIPGEIVHMIADCHIYDRHVPMIQELIGRKEYPAPKVTLNPEIKDFYDFTPDDVYIEGYEHGEQIKDIPIAI